MGAGSCTQNSVTRTVKFTVPRCLYKASANEVLETIGRQFGTNRNFLWTSNPTITNPDIGLSEGQTLRVGHTYTIKAGDTYNNIASRFGTTVQALLDTNSDLVKADALTVGKELCV